MASSLTELWKWLECTVMLHVCLYVPSTCLPWMSLLKSRPFYFFPFVRFIPLFSLVSGPTLEVTYALLLAFENTHPNLHLLLFFFVYLLKCIPVHSPGKTRKARARLTWKGHFHSVFGTVSSEKSHRSHRGRLSFSMTFPDLASIK